MKQRPPALRGRLSRWLLVASAACGQVAFLHIHSQLGIFRSELGSPVGWLLALTAVAAPFAVIRLVHFLHKSRGISIAKARRLSILEWLPLAFARVDDPILFVVTSLVILTSHALARPKHDAISPWALAGGLSLTLIGAATTPSIHWLWLLPLALTTFGTALVLLHVNRGLAQRDALSRWSFMHPTALSASLPKPLRLAVYGLPFTALTLLCIPIVSLGIISIPNPLGDLKLPALRRTAATERRAAAEAADESAIMEFKGVFPSDISFGRGVARLRHATVMLVTPPEHVGESAFRKSGPYYLRGFVQDHFNETGVTYGGGGLLTEFSAGRNEWIQLNDEQQFGTVELDIYQQPLLTRQGSWNILFSPQPVQAVRAETVKFDPDGVLVSLDGDREWKRYTVRAGINDARTLRPAGNLSRHPNARFTQLPTDSSELEQLTLAAKRISAEATTDGERVNSIVSHFKENFLYTLTTHDTPGLAGILDFMERRSGHCTDFAASSALLLRTLGIPARIATGFLADEWSDEAGGFVITTAEGHAWLEVHFEDLGWLRFEPTPSARRRQAIRAAARDSESGFGVWLSDLGSDFTYWASTGMDASDLRLWAQTLASGPRALAASFDRQPYIFLGWLFVLLASWYAAIRLTLKRAHKRTRRRSRRTTPEETEYASALRRLAKQGHQKSHSQTPREFALQVACADPEWKGFVNTTEVFYRARFASAR